MVAAHVGVDCSRIEAEKWGGQLVCYGDCALRADDGRSLGSGARIPERRAEPVVGRSSRGDGMCLQLLRPMVSKRQRPLYDPVRLLYPQLQAIGMGVPFARN